MNYELPDFETLVALAKNDPAALDRIRKEASETIINGARQDIQQRLRGLQFQIDMEIRRSKSPLDGCIRISRMMHDSLSHFRQTIQQCLGEEPVLSELKEEKPEPAQILRFPTYS